MTLPRYPEYKNSGFEWIGEIPSTWSVSSLKRGFKIVGGTTPSTEEENWNGPILWATPTDLSSLDSLFLQSTKRTLTHVGLASCGCSLLPEGSIILSTRAPIGSLAVNTKQMTTNQGCKGLIPYGQADVVFFAYVLSSSTKVLNNLGKGTTFLELSGDELGRFPVTFPIREEQTQIAHFLNHETAKIDALIHEQKRLIELLQEKRQAVISHAVTNGLDPDVPMKDSGVEWLGEVPAHWQVSRLKHVVSDLKAGPFGSALTKDMYKQGGYRVYGQEQVIPQDFNRGDYYIDEERYRSLQQYSVKPDDILISCVGTFGKIAIVPKDIVPGIINPRLIRLRSNKHVNAEFLKTVLQSDVVFEQFSFLSRGGTMDVINIGTLNDIWLLIPTLDEQRALTGWIKQKVNAFKKLSDTAYENIKLLSERRSALISAAVTGKIDVRDWRPPADESAFDEEVRQSGLEATA